MKNFFCSLAILSSIFVFSQDYVDQVFILNEGYFDYTSNQIVEPVTIGVFNPSSQVYNVIDTIQGARFASDLILDQDFLYVAADNMIYKYDKSSYDLLESVQLDGVRNLAIWKDKVIATRGDYDNITFTPIFFNSYLLIFNKSDLSFYLGLDTTIGPKWATQNIIVDGDSAYIAINNAYEWGNYKGIVGILDLNTYAYVNEIDLGPDGKNPDNMVKSGDAIYTINNKDWSGSSISKISTLTNNNQTMNLSNISTGCGTSCLRNGKINYQMSGDTMIYQWDVATLSDQGVVSGLNNNFYHLAYDDINDLLYASSTDYFSYGDIHIYDQNNVLIYSFSSGVSPGNIVFDVKNTTSIKDNSVLLEDNISPIYNLLGKRVNNSVDVPGIYIQNSQKFFMNK